MLCSAQILFIHEQTHHNIDQQGLVELVRGGTFPKALEALDQSQHTDPTKNKSTVCFSEGGAS